MPGSTATAALPCLRSKRFMSQLLGSSFGGPTRVWLHLCISCSTGFGTSRTAVSTAPWRSAFGAFASEAFAKFHASARRQTDVFKIDDLPRSVQCKLLRN